MSNKTKNTSWKPTIYHIFLLKKFIGARDIHQVAQETKMNSESGESSKDIIHHFIENGFLVPANPSEILSSLFSLYQLREFVKELNLLISGNKQKLSERLILADRRKFERLIPKNKFFICSDIGNGIISNNENRWQQIYGTAAEYKLSKSSKNIHNKRYRNPPPKKQLVPSKKFSGHKTKRQMPYEDAMIKSIYHFKKNNVKEACYVYNNSHGILLNDTNNNINPYYYKKFQYVLDADIKVLKKIKPRELSYLKVAACMKWLWNEEISEYLLSKYIRINKIAINYLITYAKIKCKLSIMRDNHIERIRITFRIDDIQSCECCQKLDGKIFDLSKFPELPMVGCNSYTGCKCHLENVHGFKSLKYGTVAPSNSLETLRILKSMLDENLISKEEFEDKKSGLLKYL